MTIVFPKGKRIAIKILLLGILLSLGYQCFFLIVPQSIQFVPMAIPVPDFDLVEPPTSNNATSVCSPVIPLQELETYLPNLASLQTTANGGKIWKGPGVSTTQPPFLHNNQSTCFFFDTPQSKHFPHAMQQLYRCWSYWRLHPGLPPVLIGPAQHRGFRPTLRPDFFTSMLQALQHAIGLRVVAMNYSSTGAVVDGTPNYSAIPELDVLMESLKLQQGILSVRSTFEHGDGFALASVQDSVELRKAILGVHSSDERRDWQSGCPFPSDSPPRIAILNRDERLSKRSILNTIELARGITDSGLSTTVPVVYFEKATFQDQTQFFNDFDVVLSPHGAQLTSMAFMPSCGGILEFSLGVTLCHSTLDPWHAPRVSVTLLCTFRRIIIGRRKLLWPLEPFNRDFVSDKAICVLL